MNFISSTDYKSASLNRPWSSYLYRSRWDSTFRVGAMLLNWNTDHRFHNWSRAAASQRRGLATNQSLDRHILDYQIELWRSKRSINPPIPWHCDGAEHFTTEPGVLQLWPDYHGSYLFLLAVRNLIYYPWIDGQCDNDLYALESIRFDQVSAHRCVYLCEQFYKERRA